MLKKIKKSFFLIFYLTYLPMFNDCIKMQTMLSVNLLLHSSVRKFSAKPSRLERASAFTEYLRPRRRAGRQNWQLK